MNSSPMIRRRVLSAFLALKPARQSGGFITISSGRIIETAIDNFEPGLRTVTVDGEELIVFNRDIQERTERLTVGEAVGSFVE